MVGINTTSPNSPLHVYNSASSGDTTAAIALDTVLANNAVDIRFGSSNPVAIRIYAASSALTASPSGAGFQAFSNSSASFPGQIYFDSGANNSAALIFRTAPTSGTITTRMRIESNGTIKLSSYTSNGFVKTSSSDGTITIDTTSYTPTSRTITINGTSYDLSADRSWSINSMVYPSAGIAVSTGTAWGTSITDNSTNWNAAYTYRITDSSFPLSITSNVISISQATNTSNGYLTSTDWITFNSKQGTITLTTTGSSGSATFTANTLNIPTYTLSGLGGVPSTRTITINGTTYDLSADRTWSIAAGVSSFNTRTGAITLLDTDVTGALGYTPVTNARTITINGTTYDLSANRSWTVDASAATTRTIQKYTADGSSATYTVTGGYTVGMVDVYVNGIKLDNASGVEFTATNGTTVVLTSTPASGDIVEVYKFGGQFIANNSLRQTTAFTATAGQQVFTVNYSVGFVDVFYNGSKLAASEFTAINGTSISLGTACVVGDIVEVVAYNYTVGAFTGVGGSGTTNYISKWTASGTLGNSIISENSNEISINSANPTFIFNGSRDYALQSNDTSGAFRIIDNTAGLERFTITSTGNIGIGTSGPSSQLHIASSAVAELRIVGYGYGSTYNTTLRSISGSVGVLQFGNNGDNYIMAGNTNTGGYLRFRVNCTTESITSGLEAMSIASSGAVYKYIQPIDTNSEMQYAIVASGGNSTTTTTTNGATYKIHTFTSTGTFTVYGYGLVEILVVGGAGGGGWDVGGGGGAGGYVETSTFVKPGTYTITVGGGGSGSGVNTGTAAGGGQSTALGIIALGGGGGGNYSGGIGGDGANGGGGAGYAGGYVTGGNGTFRQGNKGGAGRADLYASGATGGGGGGAAGAGNESTNNIGGYALGGAGVVSWISGSNVTYCKGGAGGGDSWTGHQDGASNTGNGGDGAGNPNNGKNGGSGIVIIRYKV